MDIQTLTIPTPRQLRAIRSWLGVKQPSFAKSASVSLSALADYELGHRQTSEEVLRAIAIRCAQIGITFQGGKVVLEP